MKPIGAPTARMQSSLGTHSAGVRRMERTGLVEMTAPALWLKGEPLVCADLTPAQARRLAIQLLSAAEAVEDDR